MISSSSNCRGMPRRRWERSSSTTLRISTLGGAMAGDLAKVIAHASTLAHARGFVLQAAGPHFWSVVEWHTASTPTFQLQHSLIACS